MIIELELPGNFSLLFQSIFNENFDFTNCVRLVKSKKLASNSTQLAGFFFIARLKWPFQRNTPAFLHSQTKRESDYGELHHLMVSRVDSRFRIYLPVLLNQHSFARSPFPCWMALLQFFIFRKTIIFCVQNFLNLFSLVEEGSPPIKTVVAQFPVARRRLRALHSIRSIFENSRRLQSADLKSNCINRQLAKAHTVRLGWSPFHEQKNSYWICCCPEGTNYTPFWSISTKLFLLFERLPLPSHTHMVASSPIKRPKSLKSFQFGRSRRLIKIFSLVWCETNRKLSLSLSLSFRFFLFEYGNGRLFRLCDVLKISLRWPYFYISSLIVFNFVLLLLLLISLSYPFGSSETMRPSSKRRSLRSPPPPLLPSETAKSNK